MKLFKAIIWEDDPGVPGRRVEVWADTIEAAEKDLEAMYGRGHVFDLHNEEDARLPR